VTGTITTDGPAMVWYRFSFGNFGDEKKFVFTAAGTKTVSDIITIKFGSGGGSGHLQAALDEQGKPGFDTIYSESKEWEHECTDAKR
jgi:hypothetical protein